MGLISALSGWMESNRTKHMDRMKTEGKCPECYGKGYHPILFNELTYISKDNLDCPGCSGSGLYADWESQRI